MQPVTEQDIRPLIGNIKTFGTIGPKYEICKALQKIEPNDWMLKIRLVESGEETEYPYSKAIIDPEAE